MLLPAQIGTRIASAKAMALKGQDCANQFSIHHEKALFWGLAVLYKFSLDIAYVWCAAPLEALVRSYDPNFVKYMISFVLYLVLFAALPKREQDSIAFVLHLQFAFTVAPMLTLYGLANGSSRYILMVSFCVLLEAYLIFRPLKTTETVRIIGVQNYVTVALGVLALFTAVVPILYNGFAGTKAFNLSYIYEMRANAAYPTGYWYLLCWMTKAILPFGFLCFLHLKKYRWAVLLAAVQVLLYMEIGHKFVLFILLPVTIIYYFAQTKHLTKLMYFGLATLLLVTTFAYRLDRFQYSSSAPLFDRVGIIAGALVAVRMLFIPAGIKFSYYECFSTRPKLFFSDGQIGNMLGLTYPYKLSSGYIVNAFSTGSELGASEANTGYLGEAYAQMGFAGMLLMSILFALIFRSLRSYDRKESFALLTALLSVYIIILNDGALFTILFTGGMLVTYFMIFIYYEQVSKGAGNGIQRL